MRSERLPVCAVSSVDIVEIEPREAVHPCRASYVSNPSQLASSAGAERSASVNLATLR
jgi:hypothetical protein